MQEMPIAFDGGLSFDDVARSIALKLGVNVSQITVWEVVSARFDVSTHGGPREWGRGETVARFTVGPV